MPPAITLGPLLLPTDRLLAFLAIGMFLALVALADRFLATRASSAATLACVVGAVASRIAYVVMNWTSYADDPVSAFAIWQGGFSAPIGIAAAFLTLLLNVGRSRALAVTGAALGMATAAWLTVSVATAEPVRPFPRGMMIWTAAGDPIAIDTSIGRPFVVNLWATWCGPCRRELPMLTRAASAHGALPILLVNQGEDMQTVAAFLSRARIEPTHVTMDASRDLSRALDIAGYPATAFVAADGTIVRLQLGELSRAALYDGIEHATKHR
ncbi:TlpA family protein disulfide reductase [Sphingomonas sp. RRHST34]|uniref:TlpA family protein disulfide reductase n=1 Tax=Sphingomonas citri TaxID=2862499 RepID=A0ABS7BUA2_9SPHN|nr:TlpA disulfide reductase family protein [Sphingomonas citri]MBW6533161.1 TlpA family protein disulfide reductase [Sphingomonas citri]